jgi:hypothetical protein
MQEKAQLSEGNAFFFSARKHKSVDKQGKVSSASKRADLHQHK